MAVRVVEAEVTQLQRGDSASALAQDPLEASAVAVEAALSKVDADEDDGQRELVVIFS
jgi:hypothetical protein